MINVHGFCFTLSRQLNSVERQVFKENIHLHGASSSHLKEATELQKMKQKLEEDKILLSQEKVSVLVLVLFHSPPERGPWSPGNRCKCTENNFFTARPVCSYELRVSWRKKSTDSVLMMEETEGRFSHNGPRIGLSVVHTTHQIFIWLLLQTRTWPQRNIHSPVWRCQHLDYYTVTAGGKEKTPSLVQNKSPSNFFF